MDKETVAVDFADFVASKSVEEIVTNMAMIAAVYVHEQRGDDESEPVPTYIKGFMEKSGLSHKAIYDILSAVLEIVYNAENVPDFDSAVNSVGGDTYND